MQVPFHLPEQGHRVVHGRRPGQLQVPDPLGQGARPEQGPHQPPVHRYRAPGQPGRGQHQGQSEHHHPQRARPGTGLDGGVERRRGGGGQRPQGGPGRVVAEQRPPHRVTQVDHTAGPEPEREVLQGDHGQLEQQVAGGPPAGAVPQPRVQPQDDAAGRPAERAGRYDLGVQEPAGQAAVPAAQPPGQPQVQHQQHQPDHRAQHRAGDQQPGRQQERDEKEAGQAERYRDQAVQGLAPGLGGERGPQQGPDRGPGQPSRPGPGDEASGRGDVPPEQLAHSIPFARLRSARRRLLPSSLVPRSSVQSPPRTSGSLGPIVGVKHLVWRAPRPRRPAARPRTGTACPGRARATACGPQA